MEDEKYVYYQDLKEKKSTGYSARKQRSHCGKGGRVKLPSDYLTKKELKNMSGECKSYRLNEPMKWAEFKAMPEDLQRTYIAAIRAKYNAPISAIAEMMGYLDNHLGKYLVHTLGMERRPRGNQKWDKEGFWAWVGGVPKQEEPAEVEQEVFEVEMTAEEAKEVLEILDEIKPCEEIPNPGIKVNYSEGRKFAYPISGNMNFEGMAQDALALLDAVLFGKNIKLSVSWEVCDG
jgi:hypothetical protein